MARANGTRHEFVFDETTETFLQDVMEQQAVSASEAVRRAMALYHDDMQSEDGKGALVLRLKKVRELTEQLSDAVAG